MEQRPQKQMILFKPANHLLDESKCSVSKTPQNSLKLHHGDLPVLVPDWFDHPLGNFSLI